MPLPEAKYYLGNDKSDCDVGQSAGALAGAIAIALLGLAPGLVQLHKIPRSGIGQFILRPECLAENLVRPQKVRLSLLETLLQDECASEIASEDGGLPVFFAQRFDLETAPLGDPAATSPRTDRQGGTVAGEEKVSK